MKIEDKSIVSFHYVLHDVAGKELESSRDGDPLSFLFGGGQIIPGLEQALLGRQAGESFEVTVEPDQAYGERRPNMTQRISSKHVKQAGKLTPGQQITLQTQQGPMAVTVVKVGRFNIDVDANHPLAGETLTFAVEITAVREASEEELAHGHAHGPGGHQH